MHFVVDHLTGRLEIQRVNGLVCERTESEARLLSYRNRESLTVAIILVAVEILCLTAVTRVCTVKREVSRLRVHHLKTLRGNNRSQWKKSESFG